MAHYPPPHHQDNDRAHLIEVIKRYPLAMLISVDDHKPVISHLPLIYNDDKLIGHLDRYNPQAALLKGGREVTVVFTGPQCYISPSIYSSSQLPTYNYIRVHLQGTVQEISDPQHIMDSMIEMTSILEGPSPDYVLEPDNPMMAKLIDYVKGFKIEITQWEGKFKLSQDKSAEDMEQAKEELIRVNQEHIKVFLNQVLSS